jgi:hypothetical protein
MELMIDRVFIGSLPNVEITYAGMFNNLRAFVNSDEDLKDECRMINSRLLDQLNNPQYEWVEPYLTFEAKYKALTHMLNLVKELRTYKEMFAQKKNY